MKKERCEECGKEFMQKDSGTEAELFFCSKKCSDKCFNRSKIIRKLNKKILQKHKNMFKNVDEVGDFGEGLAAMLFIGKEKLDLKFNSWTHSGDYVKTLKKEVKLTGTIK